MHNFNMHFTFMIIILHIYMNIIHQHGYVDSVIGAGTYQRVCACVID